jgi:hypothetical protein
MQRNRFIDQIPDPELYDLASWDMPGKCATKTERARNVRRVPKMRPRTN